MTLLHLLGRQCTNVPTASHLLKPSHLNLSHGFGRLTQLCDPCALISQIRSLDSHRRVFARLHASLILVHVADPSTSSHIFPVAHVRFAHTLPILWHCPIPPLSTHRYPDAQLTKSHGAGTWHTARFSPEMPHTLGEQQGAKKRQRTFAVERRSGKRRRRDVEKVSSRHVRKCTPQRKSLVFSHQTPVKCIPKLFATYLVAQPTLFEHV